MILVITCFVVISVKGKKNNSAFKKVTNRFKKVTNGTEEWNFFPD